MLQQSTVSLPKIEGGFIALMNHAVIRVNLCKAHNFIPLEPELVISTPTYDPFGTETTYKSKLFLYQMGH